MPFKSEKQRRFLWAEHPEIAKRWAHEYPESNKKLPMYADKKTNDKEKKAALQALSGVLSSVANYKKPVINSIIESGTKAATDGLMYVKLPESDKPTYAGQDKAETSEKKEEKPGCNKDTANHGSNSVEAIFGKLAVVLSKPLREMMEAQQAMAEARDPRFVPQNLALKRLSLPSPTIPPPMGMTAPAPQQANSNAQQSSAGGGSNPQHNPINAFGPLGAKGQLNGNAAFGQKNSPDSSKTASEGGAWTRAEGKSESGGLNAKGRASLKAQGHDIKAPVTESNPKGERAGRQNSFCARMCGMKSVNTGAATAKDPDSRINKSLRKWNCKCASALEFGMKMAYDWEGRRQYTHVEDRRATPLGDWSKLFAEMPLSTQARIDPKLRASLTAADRGATLSIPGATPQARAVESYVARQHSRPPAPTQFNAGRAINDVLGRIGFNAPNAPNPSAPKLNPIKQEVSGMMNRFGPTLPPNPPPMPQAPAAQQKAGAFAFGEKLADQNGGMFGPAGYMNTLSRWYNPWTTQQVTDPTEQNLMRAGQGALGLGAAAGVGAAGVAAAAPALASTNLSALPAYFAGNTAAQAGAAGTAGAAGAVAGNPNARQQMFPTVNNAVQGVGNFANNAMGALNKGVDIYANKVEPTLNKLNYKPDAVISDAYAATRGDFSNIKGPGLLKTPTTPAGAPSFPKPMAISRQLVGGIKSMLPK